MGTWWRWCGSHESASYKEEMVSKGGVVSDAGNDGEDTCVNLAVVPANSARAPVFYPKILQNERRNNAAKAGRLL